MTSLEAIILILGTGFLFVSILLLAILTQFKNLLGMFIRDSIQRQTAHLQAVENGYVLDDEQQTLEPGLVHFDEEDFDYAEVQRQELLKLGLKRGEDG